MTTAAIEISRAQTLQEWKSPAQIKARITAIQQLMQETLKEGLDYGIIPGMPAKTKPSLWKPGSEQILAMFQMAVDPVIEDLSTEDCFRYRVSVRLSNANTGLFLGAGIGEASTDETKYKWRRTYSQNEFNHTPEDRRRIKYGSRNDGSKWVDYEEMQVRQEPSDLANTCLKIAKKRAQIDATLTVTGASSMFEQDLEDLEEETREEITRDRAPRPRKPKAQPQPVGDVICASCGEKNKHLPDCKFATQCPECHGPAGKHATGCSRKTDAGPPSASTEAQKPSEPPPTDPPDKKPLKWLVQVDAVDKREGQGRKFLLLTCVNVANEQIILYCWHTGEMRTRLLAMPPKTRCIFIVKPQPSGDKTYYAVEEIVEITGELKAQGELIKPDDWD